MEAMVIQVVYPLQDKAGLVIQMVKTLEMVVVVVDLVTLMASKLEVVLVAIILAAKVADQMEA